MPGQQAPTAHPGSGHSSPSSQPGFVPRTTKESLGATCSLCPTLGVRGLLPLPPSARSSLSECCPRGRAGSGEGAASVPCKGQFLC